MKAKIIFKLLALTLLPLLVSCGNDPELPSLKYTAATMYIPPRLVAHRGMWNVPGSAQNSLTSLRLAFEELRFRGAETDVRQTSDGRLVLSHESEIDGHVIGETPFDVIRGCHLPNGEPVPTLEEALDLLSGYPDKILLLDIKEADIDILAETVNDYNLGESIYYKSFSMKMCRELKSHDLCPVFLLTWNIAETGVETCAEEHFDGVSAQYLSVWKNKDYLNKFHSRGLKVLAWTLFNQHDLEDLLSINADLVLTDLVPSKLR